VGIALGGGGSVWRYPGKTLSGDDNLPERTGRALTDCPPTGIKTVFRGGGRLTADRPRFPQSDVRLLNWTVSSRVSIPNVSAYGRAPSPVSPGSGTRNPHPARPSASSPAPRGEGSARGYPVGSRAQSDSGEGFPERTSGSPGIDGTPFFLRLVPMQWTVADIAIGGRGRGGGHLQGPPASPTPLHTSRLSLQPPPRPPTDDPGAVVPIPFTSPRGSPAQPPRQPRLRSRGG
jgi:hypothetical protein